MLFECEQPFVGRSVGLPFNTEGYERAKNILKSEYGKTSEIINAYINNIMGLPTKPSENPKEVDEFYKKLLYNVQSLETLGKLRDVSGNVRAVLDKLNSTPQSQAEAKVTREIFTVAHVVSDEFDALLEKFALWKALRVCCWISRFVNNSRKPNKERTKGPLTTEGIEQRKHFWITRAQESGKRSGKFGDNSLQLNLQEGREGLLECRGRILGDYPIYLPDTHPYTEKLVMMSHLVTLHGGVGLTMAKLREEFWIPRLRRLGKKVIRQCYGCKRFQAVALATPPPGLLPPERTKGSAPF